MKPAIPALLALLIGLSGGAYADNVFKEIGKDGLGGGIGDFDGEFAFGNSGHLNETVKVFLIRAD